MRYWILAAIFVNQLNLTEILFVTNENTHFNCDNRLENYEMVVVEGGSFRMGCYEGISNYRCWYNEKGVVELFIPDFYISKYEVTNSEYTYFLNCINADSNGCLNGMQLINLDKGKDCNQIAYRNDRFHYVGSLTSPTANCPVVNVTWYGANAYCKWLGGRLPTEAEWEYAARGGNNNSSFTYSGSDISSEVSWCSLKENRSYPVGLKNPNKLGVCDMSGNVWEWCADSYRPDIKDETIEDPYEKVRRGGSYEFTMNTSICSVFSRAPGDARFSYKNTGFRVVMDVSQMRSLQQKE